MLEFIFYVIVFYFVIKILNVVTRWWKRPAQNQNRSQSNTGGSFRSKYKNIEEAEFTEIESHPKKDKVQE
ncbi:MAG TPA: hypothetical protein VKA26_09245 [Ignavibacteriaceae bacterium]|nr:hypothetical protein [Ignavibacteriaceae bacterium]